MGGGKEEENDGDGDVRLESPRGALDVEEKRGGHYYEMLGWGICKSISLNQKEPPDASA